MKTLPIFIIATIIVAFSSCTQKPISAEKNPIPSVEVMQPVEHTFVSTLKLTGNAIAYQQTKVTAQTSGYLETLKADIGDFVKKGQPLAVLTNSELLQQKEKAAADLQSKASMNTRMQSILHKTPQLTTAADVENAKAAYDMATASYKALSIQIGFLQVRAPFSGIITKRYVSVGDVIQNGLNSSAATGLFDLQNLDPIRLTVDVPEADVATIRKNNGVSVNFAESPGKSFDLKVTRIAYGLSMDTKTMQVEIDMPNKSLAIRPGMYANVTFKEDRQSSVLAVPNDAISTVGGKSFLYLVDNHIVKIKPVKIGRTDAVYTEVTGIQLCTKDRIVVKGRELCSDGSRVQDQFISKTQ
jgi:RND family efflux transporter MFP subunit